MRGKYAELFGIRIAIGKREELLERCASLIGVGGAISTVNPEIMRDSLYNMKLRSAMLSSLNIPDGVGIKLALKSGGAVTDTFPGVELGEALLDAAPLTYAIIGGEKGVAERAAERLSNRHPSASAVLIRDGYSHSFRELAESLKGACADLCLVCLGSPKQEIFIRYARTYAKRTLFISLGGSVDVYSGDKKRAPSFFRCAGLEWLYRIAGEPRRIKRVPKLMDFVALSAIERYISRKNR